MIISNFFIPLFIKKNKIKNKFKKKNKKNNDKIFFKFKKKRNNIKTKKNMFYQTISNKIMLKNIKRGIKSNIVIINIYNSTRYIFCNEIFKLPKILNTLKIKKKKI